MVRRLLLAASVAAAVAAAAPAARDSVRLTASPSSIRSGDWVTVKFDGVPLAELKRNVTEYICKQDSYCGDVQLSLWVGLFKDGDDRSTIGPQKWNPGDPPWLATSPIGWKPLNATSGETSFKLEAALAPAYVFALFSNGTSWPIELAASGAVHIENSIAPQHVRLARVPSSSAMRVSWTSHAHDSSARVRWGTAPGRYTHNVPAGFATYTKERLCGPPGNAHGWSDPGWFYSATIGPFAPESGCSLYYVVGSDAMGWSQEFNFCSPAPAAGDSRLRFVAYADVGVTYVDGSQYHWMEPFAGNSSSFPLHPAPGPRRGQVLEAVQQAWALRGSGHFDLTLHVGDLAYATGYASKWDRFMTSIEPLSSRAPYMTAHGNHERDWPGSGSAIGGTDSGGECGVPTEARFLMPVQNRSQDLGWYSFEQGPVHFLIMDTEMSSAKGTPQWQFLQRDLSSVDRKRTPWIIVAGHRPMYSSSNTMQRNASYNLNDGPWWPDVEALLVQYQVDLCLWGHVHNAEQTCPLAKGKCVQAAKPGDYDAPVHAVIGNAGQSLSTFCVRDDCCCSAVEASCPEACAALPVWSRWRLDSFGYSIIEAEGSTDLTVSFYQDCVGKLDVKQMKDCTEFNKFVHSFTIHRRPGLRAAAEPQDLVI